MPRLAIVIRAVWSTESLEATLLSVLENRPADTEILVALAGPYSDPYDLKGEVRFVEAPRGSSPSDAINEAIAASRAPFVHLLASGCTVTEGWADCALARFGDRQLGAVAPAVVQADKPDRLLAAGLGYRASGRRYLVGTGEPELSPDVAKSIVGACGFAAFYRRAALDQVGGLASCLDPAQADVDLALALRELGASVAVEPQSRVLATSDVDACSPSFRRALHDERLFWRNLPAQGRLEALAAHGGLIAWEFVSSLPRPRAVTQLAARALAVCQAAFYRRQLPAPPRGESSRRKSSQWRVDRPHGASRGESARTAPTR